MQSDEPSSNPSRVHNYCSLKLLEKNENKRKRDRGDRIVVATEQRTHLANKQSFGRLRDVGTHGEATQKI